MADYTTNLRLKKLDINESADFKDLNNNFSTIDTSVAPKEHEHELKDVMDLLSATASTQGTIQLATQAEVDEGINNDKAVTPATLKGSSTLFAGGDDANGNADDKIMTPASVKVAIDTQRAFATGAEANTGTNDKKVISPLTLKGAINAIRGFATKAQAEAATDNTTVMTPLRTKEAAIALGISPAGSVIMFAGSAAPTGWLFCKGQSVAVATYPNLYTMIGNTYGGTSTAFNVPDMQGLFVRGVSATNPLGAKQDDTIQTFRGTVHGMAGGGSGVFKRTGTRSASMGFGSSHQDGELLDLDLSAGGVRTSSETRPKNIALNYIIKA